MQYENVRNSAVEFVDYFFLQPSRNLYLVTHNKCLDPFVFMKPLVREALFRFLHKYKDHGKRLTN
jgi:hypothetical protein